MTRDDKMRTLIRRTTEYTARDAEDGSPIIEGYFAVYNSNYDIAPGMSESIAPGAFGESLSGDIRMLTNHDTTLVIARTAAGTMELKSDTRGVWARGLVNPKDTDALNTHARVERGDVSQCSIGFEIIDEETEFRDDGSVHWTITKARLHEVSVCTFPAYEETSVSARMRDREELNERRMKAWRQKQKERLNNGIKSTHAEEED